MIYLQLYAAFLLIGLLTVGGGYAALPLIMEQCVTTHGWISVGEYSDLITIAEITPGVIAINSATYVGLKTCGVLGSVCAALGFVTAPFIIVSLLYYLYRRYSELRAVKGALDGVKPAVAALIASAGLTIMLGNVWSAGVSLAGTDWLLLVLTAAAFFVLKKWKPNQILVIFGCGALAALWELLSGL